MTRENIEKMGNDTVNTFPKLLLKNYSEYGNTIAMRKKNFGIWNEYSWEDCYNNIKYFALGLVSLGLEIGDKVCIIGDNDPEWFWAEVAVIGVGGIAVGAYIDAIPSELEYIAGHAECSFAVAKDQEQVDKFLQIKDKLPKLLKVIYWDPKGMFDYSDNPIIIDFKDVEELGKKYEETYPDLFQKRVENGRGEDTALIAYTSGTTGLPKGALISNEYLVNATMLHGTVAKLSATYNYLSFTPPAWMAEQLNGIGAWLYWRVKVSFPEEPETVNEDLRELGPDYVGLGPRQWESLISMVQVKINDTSALRRLIYNLSLPIGYKIADIRLTRMMNPTLFWGILYKLANWICFRPIRDSLGLTNAKLGTTAGSILGPDVFRWYRAIGVPLKEAYGLSEITPMTFHRGDVVRAGTVGQPMPYANIRISEEGEVLLKSDLTQFKGYYKAPDKTAEKLVGGWVKSGDAGFIDEEGNLVLWDRLEAMLKLSHGFRYSPTYVENRLKFSPYIKDAMVVGSTDTDYLFAIINIDFDNVGKWAEKNRISYTTFVDLSQKAEVYDLIQRDVEKVNKRLPSGVRVAKYSLLHKEFDADEGELTRTRKLKRSVLEQRYDNLIQAAYGGKPNIETEAEVKYRDGRVGKLMTAINIRTVE